MRLTCPNCNAQYEVPVDVIPDAGRDVQCSNCGHTWFQHHPDFAPEAEDPDDLPEAVANDAAFEDDLADAETAPASAPPQSTGPETPPAARRRGLDPSVAEVLREEAEREAKARRSGGDPLESQPELGLDSAAETEEERRTRQARERMMKMRGPAATEASERAPGSASTDDTSPAPRAERAASASSRSEMLPDIEEINQTLRAATDRRPAETPEGRAPDDPGEDRGGFSRGLAFGILIAVLALAVYIFAAPLAETVPALAPALDTYVAQVNDLRVWLQSALERLGEMIGGAAAPAPE